mgnify:CR=1 FL=1
MTLDTDAMRARITAQEDEEDLDKGIEFEDGGEREEPERADSEESDDTNT